MLTEEKTNNPARFTKSAYSKPKNGLFVYRTNGHLVHEPDIQVTSQRRAAANSSFVRSSDLRPSSSLTRATSISFDGPHRGDRGQGQTAAFGRPRRAGRLVITHAARAPVSVESPKRSRFLDGTTLL